MQIAAASRLQLSVTTKCDAIFKETLQSLCETHLSGVFCRRLWRALVAGKVQYGKSKNHMGINSFAFSFVVKCVGCSRFAAGTFCVPLILKKAGTKGVIGFSLQKKRQASNTVQVHDPPDSEQ